MREVKGLFLDAARLPVLRRLIFLNVVVVGRKEKEKGSFCFLYLDD